jgi:hypothetical protein
MSNKDHFKSFSGWRDISNAGEPKNSHLVGHFESNQHGLIGPHSVSYTPSQVVITLAEHLREPRNRGLTDHDVSMMAHAVKDALKMSPRSDLAAQWEAYSTQKATKDAIAKAELGQALAVATAPREQSEQDAPAETVATPVAAPAPATA